MSLPDAKRLTDLEADNTRIRTLLAEQVFEDDVIKDVLRRSGGRTCAQAAGAEHEQKGLSERRALTVMQMSDSA
jgi:putative transposase